MALTSKICPYDPQWPLLFTAENRRIAGGFGAELIGTHHIGSTAVPGLSAKPEIDILVVVSEHLNEVARNKFMRTLGYVRGSDLSAGHHFYRRDVDGVRTHKIHVCVAGHEQIARMLCFRDLLRKDSTVREQYQDLKLQLEANNRGGIAEYLAHKAPYIDALMNMHLEVPQGQTTIILTVV
ncbi:GrpB family protein [Pseudomonas sp. O39]|uniref:GrpB family protein n=1 Tax=Pseudomonas sp. O39 TaxID=3379130 RepID=UPI00387B56E5